MALTRPSLSVALCTFNGERFLGEQLASLARQTVPPGELVIGDDGSSDATLRIAEQFAATASFPVRIIARVERLGHADNFLATARECNGSWIAFADQDDVWLPSKLEEVLTIAESSPELLLVNQRALLCDADLTPRDEQLFPPDPKPGFHATAHRRLPLVWPGFLMTFRARLLHDFDARARPVLAPTGERIGHGRWLFMLAAALGGYHITDAPSARYRRHNAALTGDYRTGPRIWSGFRDRALSALISEEEYARTASDYLRRLAPTASRSEDCNSLIGAARDYDRAARAFKSRIACYEKQGAHHRSAAWFKAAGCGAYLGPALFAGGWRAAVKDAAAILGPASVDQGS